MDGTMRLPGLHPKTCVSRQHVLKESMSEQHEEEEADYSCNRQDWTDGRANDNDFSLQK